MKPLDTTFTKKGWTHEQVLREGLIALYRRWKDDPATAHWEVIRIQENAEREIAGVLIPEKEAYPGDGLWGQEAWTFTRLEPAEKRFQELVAKEPERIAAREERARARLLSPIP